MNINSFYSYLEHPELLNQQSLTELSEINERYPFFQTSRVLFLKNLHLLNDYRYSDELKKVSLYAANRQVLYNLIHDAKLNEVKIIETAEQNQVVEETIQTPVEEAENEIKETVPAETVQAEIIESVAEEKNLSFESESEVEPEPVSEIKVEENFVVPEEVKPIIEEEKIVVTNESTEPISVNEEIQPEPVPELPVATTYLRPEEIVTESEKIPEPVSVEKEIKVEEVKPEPKPLEIVQDVKPKQEEVPVEKESIADIILRKVAEIKASRKEPFKEFVHPVVEKKIPQEEISVIPEIKAEEKIIVPEEIKPCEEIQITETPVIELAEKLDFEIADEIQEIVEPIVIEQKPCIEIEHFDNVEIEETRNVEQKQDFGAIEVQPEKAELIEEIQVQFEEEKPIFTPPVYDISLLLKDLPEEIEPEKPKDKSVMSMSFSEWLNFMSEEEKPAKKKAGFPDLIDSFLSNSAKISLHQQESEPLEEENLIEQDDNYISETLADILMNQGHTGKAITMYEKLALKYPEKNSYFADRIFELKNRNSNQ